MGQVHAVIDWEARLESAEARAAYYQRLADHHRDSAATARRMLAKDTQGDKG